MRRVIATLLFDISGDPSKDEVIAALQNVLGAVVVVGPDGKVCQLLGGTIPALGWLSPDGEKPRPEPDPAIYVQLNPSGGKGSKH